MIFHIEHGSIGRLRFRRAVKLKIKVIDLFCGAGGMSSGFLSKKKSGSFSFESVFAIDNDKAAIETYKANFGENAQCHDVEEWLSLEQVPSADIVVGGPPCQGFSLLNRNRSGDERRELWKPYMEIVKASGASIFVMENVANLFKTKEFDEILESAKAMGFDVQYSQINMADFGVAQTRKRAIVVGVRNDRVKNPSISFLPDPTHRKPDTNLSLDFGLADWVDVRSVIGDLEEPLGTEIRDVPAPYDLHFTRNPTELSKKRYRAVPIGGNRFDLQKNAPELTPKCWLNKPSGGTDLFGRLWWNRPSVTIRTEFFKPEKGRYLHPEQHRPITHREAARIMSFSDEFIFKGSKTEIARQIGNAVPPVFAEKLANHIGNLISNNSIDLPNANTQSRYALSA